MIIPELIEVWRIARAIGWTTEKTRRTLVKMGVASSMSGDSDSELIVVRCELEASMPAIYRIVTEKYLAGELCSNRGGKRSNAFKPTQTASKSIKPKRTAQTRNRRPA